jgi:hypothetical protein
MNDRYVVTIDGCLREKKDMTFYEEFTQGNPFNDTISDVIFLFLLTNESLQR